MEMGKLVILYFFFGSIFTYILYMQICNNLFVIEHLDEVRYFCYENKDLTMDLKLTDKQ